MFVNKIGNFSKNQVFKGYNHEIDKYGNQVQRFNYPYDFQDPNSKYYVEFYNVRPNRNNHSGYEVIADKNIHRVQLQPNGTVVNLKNIGDLDISDAYAYRIVSEGGERHSETGIKEGDFVIVTTRGTTPMVQGPGVLSMPDLHRPGAYYDLKTGAVHYSSDRQKQAESITRTFSNHLGGTLAGYEYELNDLDSPGGYRILDGVKVLFSTPILGGDNRSPFLYWNKNNDQVSPSMGTLENYENFVINLYRHGIKYVNDVTLTSEGLEGCRFIGALRYLRQGSQFERMFRISGSDNGPLGLGVIPKHDKNLRHKVINPPTLYTKTGEVVDNPKYNPDKETYIQIYDASQVTPEQANDIENPIDVYRNIASGHSLDINSHDDTVIPYKFEIVHPEEYTKRLKELRDYNKNAETPIEPNSPLGTRFIAQFSNFAFITKTDGGFQTWDANTDMSKINTHISGYDEKMSRAIVDSSRREYGVKATVTGTYETRDIDYQTVRYFAGKSRIEQILYTAQVLQGARTKDKIAALINNGQLPKEAELSEEEIKNVLKRRYRLRPKKVEGMDRDEVTVRALMRMPLTALEVGDNVVTVLSSSHFSNRATNRETLGLTRYELMRKHNPHLLEEYSENYLKMDEIYKNDLKNFADMIIKKIDETSSEKLLDENGEYTVYGEYIIEEFADNILKYALLKALGGKDAEAWTLPNGKITYDYDKLRESVTLKQLGVKAGSLKDEAVGLRKVIEKGLKGLTMKDVDFVAESISTRISGTDLTSFRLAEAMVDRASLGLDFRLDAIKDKIDMDAVRNGDLTFDDAWDQFIDYCRGLVQAIKSENPHSYIVAEITNVEDLMRATYGELLDVHNNDIKIGNKYQNVPDAMKQFYLQTGIVSEAGYAYTSTDLLRLFSPDFEEGYTHGAKQFMENFSKILDKGGVDFVRNLWTFADNHDKPSVIHGMALDIPLLTGEIQKNDWIKENIMRILLNVDYGQVLPLEAQYYLYDNNYYRLASNKSAAMGKLMRECINELNEINPETKDLLKRAVANLANGCFLGDGPQFKLAFDDTPALASLEGALREMLETSNASLSENEIKAIVDIAKGKAEYYFGNKNPNSDDSQKRMQLMLGVDNEAWNNKKDEYIDKYSLYTTSICCALRDGFYAVRPNSDEVSVRFEEAQKQFMLKYNNAFIEDKQSALPFIEDSHISMRKNAFGTRDFETVIKLIIEEAEYIAHNEKKLEEGKHFEDSDKILKELFTISTKPAITKAVMYISFLSALPGIPTVYVRDMLGALGFEEKSKNVYLQNRNAVVWSELEEGPLKDLRRDILNRFKEAMEIRTKIGDALNHGTPYKVTTSDDNVPALLMQDANNNISISVFDTSNVDTNNRMEPDCESNSNKGIEYILLGAGLSLPLGMEFVNALNGRDLATYVVEEIRNAQGEVRGRGIKVRGGSYIALNKDTLKNGILALKRKGVTFKGNSKQINKQYNIVSNPYKKTEVPQEGQNLSIVAR